MIDAKTLDADIQQLLKLIDRQFGIQADDLASAMKKIGRRLPKSAHKNAAILVEAQTQARNPKIAIQMDERPLKAPYRALLRAIEAYDRKDARVGAILGTLGGLVFNLIVLLIILVAVLKWRGFV